MKNRLLCLLVSLMLCALLCSCQTLLPANEKAQVEELLRAPKLSGDYGALQTALNDWLGESAQLKYPIQGELLSPFVLQDLDGDGQQDAAVLYTTAQTANVCVAILQRDDTGSWQVRQSVEGLAETVENVSLAQLQDTDSCQLVVGYTAAQNDHYLAVYSYQDGTLSTILEQQYEQYLVENITGGSSQDLILMSTQEDGSVQIELLTEYTDKCRNRCRRVQYVRAVKGSVYRAFLRRCCRCIGININNDHDRYKKRDHKHVERQKPAEIAKIEFRHTFEIRYERLFVF